ncbi:DUF4179 domain-containing protein [Brevibacillus borstelensis]|uniref:DUF4179 domain-containing protein n=1 Tax=Brevibacillus borstelensis TaxID=45462 RepID=UPI0030C05AD8
MSISKKIEHSLSEHFEEIAVPEEVDQRVRESFIQFHQERERKTMKKRLLVFGIAAAILLPTGVFAALGGPSYFFNSQANINGLVNEGVKRAISEGLSVPIDEKITDQGITIHFKEMYVEDTKILVHYSIEKQDGTLVPYEFDTSGLQLISAGKTDGVQTENPTFQQPGLEGFSVVSFLQADTEGRLPFYLTDDSGKEVVTGMAVEDKPEGTLAFLTDGSHLPKPLYLNVGIDRIGKTKGSWKGQFVVDQSKAEQATKAAQ